MINTTVADRICVSWLANVYAIPQLANQVCASPASYAFDLTK